MMSGEGRRRVLRGLVAAAACLIAGICLYYRPLLAAAVTPNPLSRDPASAARGATIWSTHCAGCHGVGAHGDGPAAAGLSTKPEDLTDLPGPPVFPDGVIAYRIAHGSEVMPAWGGMLSERDIWDLVSFIRALHD